MNPLECECVDMEEVRNKAIILASSTGINMRMKDGHIGFCHAPFTLYPSKFPHHLFKKAYDLGPLLGLLTHKIANDVSFLIDVSESVCQADPFTRSLLEIFKTVHITDGGPAQTKSLGILRSDYMMHVEAAAASADPIDSLGLRQVEINTIASSFGMLSAKTTSLHQYLLDNCYDSDRSVGRKGSGCGERVCLPANRSFEEIPRALAETAKLFKQDLQAIIDRSTGGDPVKRLAKANVVVVMIVQKGERNTFDQFWVESELSLKHQTKLIRRSLCDFTPERITWDNTTKVLTIDGYVVGVVYFRACYTPNDYTDGKDWQARLLLERSLAIKCPNIGYHLAGTKKMQQAVAVPGVLERLLKDVEDSQKSIALIRSVFAGLYSLQNNEGDEWLRKAAAAPHQFVLKPQREGGGNNIYDEELRKAVTTWTKEQLSGYILMEKILPPIEENAYYVRDEVMGQANLIGEFGVFTLILADSCGGSGSGSGSSGGVKIHFNYSGGHLFRSKSKEFNDGGVAAGVAMLDSPLLV